MSALLLVALAHAVTVDELPPLERPVLAESLDGDCTGNVAMDQDEAAPCVGVLVPAPKWAYAVAWKAYAERLEIDRAVLGAEVHSLQAQIAADVETVAEAQAARRLAERRARAQLGIGIGVGVGGTVVVTGLVVTGVYALLRGFGSL